MGETMLDLWGEPVDPPRPPAFGIAECPAAREPMAEWRRRELARDAAREREHRRWASGNPALRVHGAGPEGATCRSCAHLLRLDYHGRTYVKCEVRGVSHGAATDHRVGWPACGKYAGKMEAHR